MTSDESVAESTEASGLSEAISSGAVVAEIPVRVSYEIIKLFSEGLYQSPHKAVEELVSNSYDAGATSAHVLLPQQEEDGTVREPLWVLDDGDGMDRAEFEQLWRVADSTKRDATHGDRLPIGQFGIGKLAAYVLAQELTHLSKKGERFLCTRMDFTRVTGHQYEKHDAVTIDLVEVGEDGARAMLADVQTRDPEAWAFLFGDQAAETWTAAALSNFRDLYDRLQSGTLSWVLRTGLPLHSNFKIWLDGQELLSPKQDLPPIRKYVIGGEADTAAESLGLDCDSQGVRFPGLDGRVSGTARIFEKPLNTGKSQQYGRSHGFFVRVRKRVINLEDELFGLDALNHAAWARFAMEIEADGLHDKLLSSREGVRETESVRALRNYLYKVFNVCRRAYDEWYERQLSGIDLDRLLRDAPSLLVTEPLLEGVRRVVGSGQESFYVSSPVLDESEDREEWLRDFEEEMRQAPFAEVLFEDTGPYDRALHYIPQTRTLVLNTEHPFVNKLVEHAGKQRSAASLFGSSELLMDVLLQDHGIPPSTVIELLKDRDRLLRLLAGDAASSAGEVLRLLERVANKHETALERATGLAFRALGFEYERRGENRGGPDGVLYATLGHDGDAMADYKVVYDAKQTNQPSVPAGMIDMSSLETFAHDENADYAFFVAVDYQGQDDQSSKLNRKLATTSVPITLLRIEDLASLVRMHYRYGVPLTTVRELFSQPRSVGQVQSWLSDLDERLREAAPVPVERLLLGIEARKTDKLARPNVIAVRAKDEELEKFPPERLQAQLHAISTIIGERWLEVEVNGDISLNAGPEQILEELRRCSRDLFGASPTEPID